ncbi:MAG TPA: nitroreductase family protein [Saprospiraceae bacterium]|nr:nitroreductase family protein [Saprospiraceae bacterium]
MNTDFPFIPYNAVQFDEDQMLERAKAWNEFIQKRRSVREFSSRPIPIDLVNSILQSAGSAPSGANKQPWTFCVVSDPKIKREIRIAAEKEELENYESRMSEEWLRDLAPLGTDWKKPFLEDAPYLIVVFKKSHDLDEQGNKLKNYYVQESVGIACGFLIAAVHNAGLVTLTHTPSPMNFLCKILNRPENEKPFLLLPLGFPADEITVPDIQRKKLEDIVAYY